MAIRLFFFATACAVIKKTSASTHFSGERLVSSAVGEAQAVVAADFDGDNYNDLLVGSWGDNAVIWFKNEGNAFADGVPITTEADQTGTVFAADLDGDGDDDVLSASFGDNSVLWFENTDGKGTFSTASVISDGALGAFSVYAVDIDGDQDLDVLSASHLDNSIRWFENSDSMGSFVTTVDDRSLITSDADGVWLIFAADIDGDNDVDVVSASRFDGSVRWYNNTDGLGTFETITISSNVTNSYSTYAADMDGDGDVDVVAVSEADSSLYLFENTDGLGTFSSGIVISSNLSGTTNVFTADLDHDDDMDILVASRLGDKVSWFENLDGAGTFNTEQIITDDVNGPVYVRASDMDGDGDLDVLVASDVGDTITWYENQLYTR
ncbi:unnamed protein product [Discosporangium mesarthrocarpum]